jgi:hypothetical protein
MPELVSDPDLVTNEWLTEVLRHGGAIDDATSVSSFTQKDIGTGQVGANVRYTLSYDGDAAGPATIVCKFASRDEVSASTGVATKTYDTEISFYRDLADTVDISRPHSYFNAIEFGTAKVVLVMEDLAPAEQGDQIKGCTVEQAEIAVIEAAKLHGPRWGDPTLNDLEWLAARATTTGGMAGMLPMFWDNFVERYRSTLDDVTIETGPKLMEITPKLVGYEPVARTLTHSDYRLDNMLFDPTPGTSRPLIVVDWQTVQLGIGPSDVAYFMGNAFSADVRRSCEERLVREYHEVLVERYGVTGYSLEQCWDEYRRSSYASLLMAVFASMMVGRTDRGDQMFMAMANRSAQMADDLDAANV